MDTFPLTESTRTARSSQSTEGDLYGLNHSISQQSISTELSLQDNKLIKKRIRSNVRSTRVNSAYTPTNRFSRYKTALATFMPLRSSNTGSAELPVDSIGCFSNASFAWTRQFLITKSMQSTYNNLPFHQEDGKDSAFLLPKRTYSDSCEMNCRRLLGIYKDEEVTRGKKRASLFRVVWKFCRTRILFAALIQMLSIFIGLLGLVLFIKMIVDSMENETRSEMLLQNISQSNSPKFTPSVFIFHLVASAYFVNNMKHTESLTISHDKTPLQLQEEVATERLHRIGYTLGFITCFFGMVFLKCISNWLNLRTATRLRTAILSSIYKKAMRSSVVNHIAAHQILTLANEESEIVFAAVQSGSLLLSTIFGVIFSVISSIILLGLPGVWPLFGIIGLFILTIVIAKISTHHFRKYLAFGAMKLTIVEELCANFMNIKVLQFDSLFLNNFFEYVSQQYSALKWSEMFSSNFSGGMTSAILLGGLYLIWCDVDIVTNSSEVLVLIILFAFIIQNLMHDYCDCLQNIIQGQACLNKLKKCYNLSTPDHIKLRPSGESLLIQIRSAEFEWQCQTTNQTPFTLFVEDFDVLKSQIVGVTGSTGAGKTTLLYSILRCTQLKKGNINQKGKLAFFPDTPYILAGSLKDNILMGEPFDASNYYNAVNAMQLNEDVLVAAGADDMPIGFLELDIEQLERVVLARAIYCRREIIMLDNPMSRFKDKAKAVELFKYLIVLLLRAEKTIIVVSQNNYFLEHCQRIYRLENGSIYREGNFVEFLHIPSHLEMVKKSEMLNMCLRNTNKIDGCSIDAINVVKTQKIKSSRRSNRISYQHVIDSIETLPRHTGNHIRIKNLSVCDYLFLSILYLVNNFLYFALPLGFIIIIQEGYIEPWLSSICLGIILCTCTVDNITKIYLANISSTRNKSYQNKFFKLLMSSSVDFLHSTVISDIVNQFTDIISPAFHSYGVCLNEVSSILFASALLIYSNYWTAFVVVVAISGCIIIVCNFRFTLQHLYIHENESKRRIFAIVTNHLRGRAVIQSFENMSEFAKQFYSYVEENSTSIFMKKSIIFHSQFLVYILSSIGFCGVCLILLLDPSTYLSIHNFILAIFAFFCLSTSLNRLVANMLLLIVARQKTNILNKSIVKYCKIEDCAHAISFENVTDGVSISFKDVVCKLSSKNLMEVKKLNIQAAETIGLTGRYSNLVIPLLYRMIAPTKGSIFFNQTCISLLEEESLRTMLGTVTANPLISNTTITTFLNPNNDIQDYEISDILKELKLWEIVSMLPNKLDDHIELLLAKHRQLMCLAKCCLRKPAIILLENIHPEIQHIVDATLHTYFNDKTVIVIGGHLSQFARCDRVMELNE